MTPVPTRPRRMLTPILTVAALAVLAVSPAARADEPLATVTPSGQATLCLDNQQPSVNPDAGLSTGVLNFVGGQCPTASEGTGSGGTGGGGSTTPAVRGGSSDQGGGGGDTSASPGASATSTQSSTQSSTTSTTTNRSAALGAPADPFMTVPAAKATGVAISAVRYRVLGKKRLAISVLVRDRKRHLIRTAIVTLSGVIGAQQTLTIPRSTYTDRHGKASFVLPLVSKVSGKRLLMRITAQTPSARVVRLGSRVVPRPSAG